MIEKEVYAIEMYPDWPSSGYSSVWVKLSGTEEVVTH